MWSAFSRLLRSWRETRLLKRHAIPEPLWQRTLVQYPFLQLSDAHDRSRLRRLSTLFLGEKEFHGAAGFEISDQVAVAVAAQACLLILHLGLDHYHGFVGIVMHADQVLARREEMDEDGLVHEFDELLAGEAMEGGPVMLCWADVQQAGGDAGPAYNVVMHEFAHVLDMADGQADGVPLLPGSVPRARWVQTMQAEHQTFCQWVEAGRETSIDPYGAEGLDEFFAVAVEAFFVTPQALRAEQPRLYALLVEYFGQDPAAATFDLR